MANKQPPSFLLSGDKPLPLPSPSPSPPPLKKQKLNNNNNELVSSPLNIISSDDEDEEMKVEVKVNDDVVRVRVSGEGFATKHYLGFEADGRSYQIEESVLVTPQDENNLEMKPSVAIIKDVYETPDGSINVTGQKFYRPELLFNKNGENLETIESRILYYSFDKCEFPADSVMHKCRVHYLELHKNIPNPKQHPGFIVRKVYDSVSNKLIELLDSGFEESKQREISLLVQRTNQIIK